MRLALYLITILFVFSGCGAEHGGASIHIVKEGNFSILIPDPVKKTQKTENTVFGKQVRYFVRWAPSSVAIDKFKLFEVSYTACPPSVTADSMHLNRALDEAAENRKKDFSEVEVIESQAIELNGYPGRAFFFDDPKGNTIVTVKMCIAGGKLYDLVVIAKKNYATNNEAADFFNSFKLLD